MNKQTLLRVCIFLALVGVGLSAYSFLHNRSFIEGTFCNLNSTFSCDVVNKGPYSTMLGVPVALVGIIGYGFLLVGSILKLRQPDDRSLTVFLALASGGAVVFSLYLTSLEAFVLHVWCIICLLSQFSILMIFTIIVWMLHQERASLSAPKAL